MISSDLTSSSHLFFQEKKFIREEEEEKQIDCFEDEEMKRRIHQEVDGSTTETVFINFGRTS